MLGEEQQVRSLVPQPTAGAVPAERRPGLGREMPARLEARGAEMGDEASLLPALSEQVFGDEVPAQSCLRCWPSPSALSHTCAPRRLAPGGW